MSTSSPSSGEPEYLELGPEPAKQGRRVGLVAVVLGVTFALALPVGAFAAFRLLSGGGTQPHDVLPGNAVGYFRIDLDPSAPQKIDALRFLRTFPAFERYAGIDSDAADVREAIVDAMLSDAACDVDFDNDVEPWLGERFGVAVTAPTAGSTEPRVVAAVQVTDEQGADTGLDKLRGCDPGNSDAGGWTYLDGYMLVAKTQRQADDFAAAASSTPLSENAEFISDMERLGEPGVASMWFDGEGLLRALDDMPGTVRRQMAQSYRSGAVAFRFDPSYVELASVTTGSGYVEPESLDAVDMALPASTAVAFGIANGSDYVDQQWRNLRRLLEDRPETGLRLPGDLQALLGDSLTLAFDGARLDVSSIMGGDPSRLDLGVRVSTDPAEFRRVLRTLESEAARSGMPLRLAVQDTDDGVVAASNRAYAGQLAGGGPLADTLVFDRAVPDADAAQGVFFLNVDVLERPLLAAVPPVGPARQIVDNLTKIEAVGASAVMHEGYAEGTLRITVGD